MSLQLTIISLDFESDTTPVTTRFDKDLITFGRAASNDVVLEQNELAEFHLELRVEEDPTLDSARLFVTDLGGLSGTLLENMPLHPHVEKEMATNERIIVGSYLIKAKYIPTAATATPKKAAAAQLKQPARANAEPQAPAKQTPDPNKFFARGERRGKTPLPAQLIRAKVEPKPLTSEPEPSAPTAEEAEVEFFEAVEEKKGVAFVESREPPAQPAEEPGQFLVSGHLEAEDVNHVDFEAVKLLTLKGIITHHGKALAGVHIDAGRIGQAVSDLDGTFSFSDIEEYTPYSIAASKSGFEFSCDGAQGTLSSDIVLEFIAKELYAITGLVLHHGQPVPQVEIDGGELGMVVTDRNGRFTFNNVPEGATYNIKASKKSYRFACKNNLGKVRSNINIDFKATKLVQLSGIITHQGNPLEGVEIDAGPLGRTVTGPDGRYYFNDIPEGSRYTLSATRPGFKFQKKSGSL